MAGEAFGGQLDPRHERTLWGNDMNALNYFAQKRTMAARWNFPGRFLPCSQFLYVPTGESNRFAACSWVRPAAFRHFLSRFENFIAGHKAVFEAFEVMSRPYVFASRRISSGSLLFSYRAMRLWLKTILLFPKKASFTTQTYASRVYESRHLWLNMILGV